MCLCVPTSLWTVVWVQAGGPSEHCQRVLPGATRGSWYPVSRTSCVEAPALLRPPCHSRLDTSPPAPATPLDRNLSGHGGDGGEDGGWGRWPLRLGQPRRDRGWAGTKVVNEASSLLPHPTTALTNLLLSSPSEDGGRKREEERGDAVSVTQVYRLSINSV